MTSHLKKVLDVLKHTHRSIYGNISLTASKPLLLLYYDKQFYFVHRTSAFTLHLSNEKCKTVRCNACVSDKQNENKWSGYNLQTPCSSPSSQANRSTSQEILHVLWNPEVHYWIHNSPLYVPDLSRTQPVHAPHPISWRAILISFHLCVHLPSDIFPSDFPAAILYAPLQHTSHSSWFDHTNTTWWGVEIIQLLVMQSLQCL